MKKNVCMRIKCDECKIRYDLTNETFDYYMVFYKLGERVKNGLPMPHLLCPTCLEVKP